MTPSSRLWRVRGYSSIDDIQHGTHCAQLDQARREEPGGALPDSRSGASLNILEGEVSENPKSDLWRVRRLTAASPLNGIRSSISKNSITLFMSEVLYRTVRDGVLEDGLFDWCRRSILTLDALESDFSNYHLRFLLEFAVALGFSPSLTDLAPFAGEHLAEIRTLLESDFAGSMLLPLNGVARNEIAESLLQYIGFHSDCRLNIRSLAVLRELWR